MKVKSRVSGTKVRNKLQAGLVSARGLPMRCRSPRQGRSHLRVQGCSIVMNGKRRVSGTKSGLRAGGRGLGASGWLAVYAGGS